MGGKGIDVAGTLQLTRHNKVDPFALGCLAKKQPTTPSTWFSERFPDQVNKWGVPMLESIYFDPAGQRRVKPVSLNQDFFAAILGGQEKLKHQVVFFEPEQTWHFLDSRTNHFTPTTDQKLQILLSQYFIRCAEEVPKNVDLEPLFVDFRSDDCLRRIVKCARSILAADESFFSPDSPYKRAKGPEIHERLAKEFVKKAIKPEPQKILTVRECFQIFCVLCRENGVNPIHQRHFRPLLVDLIRQEFDLGLRRDLLDQNQKYQNGWKGLAVAPGFGLSYVGRN